MTYLLHFNLLESDALYFIRLYCLHFCESGDISKSKCLPTYIAKEHHVIIPIFIAARITNLKFLTIANRSRNYKDEIVCAPSWLYRTTNGRTYFNTAESLYNEFRLQYWHDAFNWDNNVFGLQVRYVKKFTCTMSLTNQ